MNKKLVDFVKSAAEYSQETTNVVSLAYSIVNDMNAGQQKCAEFIPAMVNKLESLDRPDGRPFVPDGFSKQAADVLASHEKTLKLLDCVLNEYAHLKAAHDKLTPPIGSVGAATKQASANSNVIRDGYESQAWAKGRQRLLET